MNKNGTAKRTRPTQQQLENKIQLLSALTARLEMASRFGFTHGNDRDLYETLGYKQDLKSSDFIHQWKRQDIARAIVDKPVKKTWEGAVTLLESTEEEETALEQAYKELDDSLGLKTKFMRADRLSQLGKYAVMVLGFDDSARDTWPLEVSPGERELRYVKVVSEGNAEILSWEKDPSHPRYGLPSIYKISLQKPGSDEQTTSLNVHHSRVLHITSDLLENDTQGDPLIKTAFNRLQDIEKLVGGSAEMFWRGARPGYSAKADKDYQMGKDVEDKLQEQIKEYEHDLRRILATEGVDIESLAQQIADPKGHVDVQLQMISALTNIPLRILIGSERGELASGQDDTNWKEYIQSRREEQAEPGIVRPFVDRMIQYQVFPEVQDTAQGYSVSWSDLFSMGEKEKAEIGSQRSNALAHYVKDAADMMVPLEGFLRYFLRLDDQEVEHLLELHEGQLKELTQEEDGLEADLDTPSEGDETSGL